ncbi:hypothetical protein LSAT2_019124 [Lamellibrachia satsuma]|nr:hypothetical protein LSAT2_019124 [Lamellibrachia satsuma]
MKLAVPSPFPAANLSSTLSSVKHLDILQMFNESYELSTTASSNTSNATLQWPLTDGVSGSVVATVVSYLMLYGTPAIILVGLIGNTLSLVVYSCTHLERASYSLYMRMLSAVDICFLVALSFVWLHRIGVNLFMSFGWCQVSTLQQHIQTLLSISAQSTESVPP